MLQPDPLTLAAPGTAPAGAQLAVRNTGSSREPSWLAEVRLRVARRVLWLREMWSGHRYEGEQVLSISHSEIDRALLPPGELVAAERRFFAEDEQARALSAEIGEVGERPDRAFQHLGAVLGLRPAESHLLALCLATAAMPAMRRVYGYLLDASEPCDPTPALASALFGEPPGWCPDPLSPLVAWRLARPLDDGHHPYAVTTGWDGDALLLPGLLRHEVAGAADPWAAGSLATVEEPPPGPMLRSELAGELAAFLEALAPCGRIGTATVEIELIGPVRSGRRSFAAAVARRLAPSRALLAVDGTALAGAEDPLSAALREVRRALLGGYALLIEHAEALPATTWPAIARSPLSFLSCSAPLAAPTGPASVRRSVELGPISRHERIELWSGLTGTPPPGPVTEWALRPGEVAAASLAVPAGETAVREICHRMLLAGTPELLTRVPLPYTWDDLVISPRTARHLRELEAQAHDRGEVLDDWGLARLTPMGRGVSALFAGPSGTGKTMATQILARSLGLDLYRVDLAGVVSKYIGETEKHLRAVFDACERAPLLLFFDEADALFGKRSEVSDAHDRYANIEVDYILQRMESFDGVAVLATNRKGDLDTAFTRRIAFIVDFSPPSPEERERLWRLALEHARTPDGELLAGWLDWGLLGSQFDLTAASIKSAALAAAFLARSEHCAVEMRHVLAATRRELEKHGKVLRLPEGRA